MLKLMMRIQKNKYIMILLSLFLVFVIMFSVTAKPVKAITGAEEAICFVLASVCSYLGIQVAVDAPATWDTLLTIFDGLTESVKNEVKAYADMLSYGVSSVITWETEIFQACATQVADWFGLNYHPVHDYGLIITVSDNPDHLGFVDGSLFELYFPSGQASCVWGFPSSVMWLYDEIKFSAIKSKFNSIYVTNESGYDDDDDMKLCILKAANGLEFVLFSPDRWHYEDCYEAQFIQFGIPEDSSSYSFSLFSDEYSFFTIPFYMTNYGYSQTISFYYDTMTNVTYTIESTSNGFAFVDIASGNYYDNREFSSMDALMDWFMTECGFLTAGVSDADAVPAYRPGDTTDDADNPFVYDPDVTAGRLDQIGAIDTPTYDTVVPGTRDQVIDMANNPDLVDVNNPSVYTGDVDLPSVDSNAWANRFPFCIPFDIVRLFSSFVSTAQAPNFHLVLMPANSFGLQNDEVSCDINFADYNVLVRLLRLFIAVAFTVWLMVITRKLIGAS